MIRYELIGLQAIIIESTNKFLNGINGKIIDETKNTLKIQTKSSIKSIIKNQVILKLKMNDKEIILDGKKIVGRPHERILKK